MFGIIAKLLEKLIDFTIKNQSAKKQKRGYKLLYVIYLNLFEIAKCTHHFHRALSGYLDGTDYYWSYLFLELNNLSSELNDLAKNYNCAFFTITIFNSEAKEKLDNIIGIKSSRIRMWAEILSALSDNNSNYPILDPDKFEINGSFERKYEEAYMFDRMNITSKVSKKKEEIILQAPTFITGQDREILSRERENCCKTLELLNQLLKKYSNFLRENLSIDDLLSFETLNGKDRIS